VQAQGVQVGALTCNVESGFGFIVGSSRAVDCTFYPPMDPPTLYRIDPQNRHRYWVSTKWGDHLVGSCTDDQFRAGIALWILWRSDRSAGIGIGAGADALVGGSGNSIALQPVSVEVTTGLNVAAGIAEMTVSFEPS
jgi:hypothetical protein